MNAHFAPIPYPDVIERPREAQGSSQALTYRPNLKILEEAADDVGAYAEGLAASIKRPLTNSLKAPKVSAPDDEGYQHAMLPLGPTSVEVHFRVSRGGVSLEAVIVGDGWCDIEHFAVKTQHAWALALEEALS